VRRLWESNAAGAAARRAIDTQEVLREFGFADSEIEGFARRGSYKEEPGVIRPVTQLR
jgi:hypothetical protein